MPACGTSSRAGPNAARRPREIIDHSIGPVWEANHVWLIFCFVVLWTAFSPAYSAITLTMFVPLTLAAVGIVLRGLGLRLPEVGVPQPRPPQLRGRVRAVVGVGAVLSSARWPAASRRAGCRRAARRVNP